MAYIRKLQSGSFQVQIRLQGLPPVTRSFKTRRKAQDFARQVEGNSEIARKLGTATKDIPLFSELVDQYLAQWQGKDLSKPSLLTWWKSHLGKQPVTKIDEFEVDALLTRLATSGRNGDRPLTGSTVNRYKTALSAVFIYFIRHPEYKRLGFTNPVRKESVSCYRENPAKDRFLTQDEQKRLLQACKRATWPKMYMLILLALTTGGRKGELLGLKWSDIDFSQRTALLGMTKNGKPRMLPLTHPVIEELMKFREIGDSLVFCNTISKVTPYETAKQWRNVLRTSGIGQCRFHDLRHTAASNLVRAGRSLFEVGTLLGHSSTAMTARYSHLCVKDTLGMVDSVMGGLQ